MTKLAPCFSVDVPYTFYFYIYIYICVCVSYHCCPCRHDDVIKWKHFSRYWPFLALFAGNSPVTGEFSSQRPVTRSFDVFLDLRVTIQSSKQSKRRIFKAPSHPLFRHHNCLYLSEMTKERCSINPVTDQKDYLRHVSIRQYPQPIPLTSV